MEGLIIIRSAKPHIDAIRGGGETIQSLMDELQAMFDVARNPDSGTLTFSDATEQTLFEESDTVPFIFFGGHIDWTGCNFGGGEDTTVKVYIKIKSGGTYRLIESTTYLAAALPSPVVTHHPNDANDALHTPSPIYNVYGVKVTATQAAVGGGWNSIDHEWFTAKRGS